MDNLNNKKYIYSIKIVVPILLIGGFSFVWYSMQNRIFFRKLSDYANNKDAFNSVAKSYATNENPSSSDWNVIKNLGINSVFVDQKGNVIFSYPLTWVDAENDRRVFVYCSQPCATYLQENKISNNKFVVCISDKWLYYEN